MQLDKLNIAVIGAGKWGMNHIVTAAELLPHQNIHVFDINTAVYSKLLEQYPEIKVYNSLSDILTNSSAMGVIISTPGETHFEIALECLNSGKHVLVEKPVTLKLERAKVLIELAEIKKLVLMAGHVLIYHPAIERITNEIRLGKIGKLQYIYSNRLNLGALRSNENILWSFAPHDISVIQLLTGTNPVNISANGACFVQPGIEDITLTSLIYPDNIHAHIFVSWLHPFKEQRMVIVGDKGMLVFEDTLETEKLKYYPKGYRDISGGYQKFEGDYEVLELKDIQPLRAEHEHFYNCMLYGAKPVTDGKHALGVLTILDTAHKNIKLKNSNLH